MSLIFTNRTAIKKNVQLRKTFNYENPPIKKNLQLRRASNQKIPPTKEILNWKKKAMIWLELNLPLT